uniref:Uncharacterized protein n=1 Tax=Ciona intestinalis TaxID=7719 RepID=H2XT19_CIOIN
MFLTPKIFELLSVLFFGKLFDMHVVSSNYGLTVSSSIFKSKTNNLVLI